MPDPKITPITALRIAYADPPYIGQARRHYANDPSGIEAQEVDHAQLINDLRQYDAWALSCTTTSLGYLLSLAPEARVCAWVKPFASWKPTHRLQYAWEPVLMVPARQRGGKHVSSCRDWVSANITMRKGTHGAKPEAFCMWLFDAIGATKEDEFFDLFPGSGVVSSCWERFKSSKRDLLDG